MRPHPNWMVVLLAIGVATLLLTSADAQTLRVTESRITSPSVPTPAWETTPRLGNTGIFDIVVYASRERLPDDSFSKSDIWYQHLDHGQAVGAPIQLTNDGQNNQMPDVSGDFITFIAYDTPGVMSGRVMAYQMSKGLLYGIGSALIIQEARISGHHVVWREGGDIASQIELYDLGWLGTARDADVIAGPIPPAFSPEIGERFVVWASSFGGQHDIFAWDLNAGITVQVTNTSDVVEDRPSTYGPWIAWEAFDKLTGTNRIMLQNMDTHELRTIVDNPAYNFRPSLDGDFLTWESTLNGNIDVFLYRLSTQQTFQITSRPEDQYLNHLFGRTVAYVDRRSGNEDIYVSTFAFVCDANDDTVVNRTDINLIFGAIGNPATGPDDPRDADGDGKITIYDARKCVLACTKAMCAL